MNFITNSPSQARDEEVARRFKRITTEEEAVEEDEDYIPQQNVNHKYKNDERATFKRSAEEQELEEILRHGAKTARSVDDQSASNNVGENGNAGTIEQTRTLHDNNNNSNSGLDVKTNDDTAKVVGGGEKVQKQDQTRTLENNDVITKNKGRSLFRFLLAWSQLKISSTIVLVKNQTRHL